MATLLIVTLIMTSASYRMHSV